MVCVIPEYVFQFLEFFVNAACQRVLLLDTLESLSHHIPLSLFRKLLQNIPTFILISMRTMIMIYIANVMEAIKAGIKGLHETEWGTRRNAPLESTVAVINDFMPEIKINVNESSLYSVSKLVETFTGYRIPRTNQL
jgi:D-citramalate synthase